MIRVSDSASNRAITVMIMMYLFYDIHDLYKDFFINKNMMMDDFNFHSGMMYDQTVDQSFIRNVLLDCNISEFLYYKIEFEWYSPLVYTVLWLKV